MFQLYHIFVFETLKWKKNVVRQNVSQSTKDVLLVDVIIWAHSSYVEVLTSLGPSIILMRRRDLVDFPLRPLSGAWKCMFYKVLLANVMNFFMPMLFHSRLLLWRNIFINQYIMQIKKHAWWLRCGSAFT